MWLQNSPDIVSGHFSWKQSNSSLSQMSLNLTFSMHHKACHLDWVNVLVMLWLKTERKGTEDQKEKSKEWK